MSDLDHANKIAACRLQAKRLAPHTTANHVDLVNCVNGWLYL